MRNRKGSLFFHFLAIPSLLACIIYAKSCKPLHSSGRHDIQCDAQLSRKAFAVLLPVASGARFTCWERRRRRGRRLDPPQARGSSGDRSQARVLLRHGQGEKTLSIDAGTCSAAAGNGLTFCSVREKLSL